MRLSRGKRIKWEPAALMVLLLGLGLWLALGPVGGPRLALRPGANKIDMRVGERRGAIEAAQGPDGRWTFRILIPGKAEAREWSAQEFRAEFGDEIYHALADSRRNHLFRVLNITAWAHIVWVAIGLGGQLAFSGRMLFQWFASERRRQSVVTESFWWFSMTGALMLFTYFVWRQDPVGILGQATGIVIYARNLRLIYKHKRRAARDEANPQMPSGPS